MNAENLQKTKNCPSCQTDVSWNITKCPYCGKGLKNWFKRHPTLTLLIVLFVLTQILFGLVPKSDQPEHQAIKKTEFKSPVQYEIVNKEGALTNIAVSPDTSNEEIRALINYFHEMYIRGLLKPKLGGNRIVRIYDNPSLAIEYTKNWRVFMDNFERECVKVRGFYGVNNSDGKENASLGVDQCSTFQLITF